VLVVGVYVYLLPFVHMMCTKNLINFILLLLYLQYTPICRNPTEYYILLLFYSNLLCVYDGLLRTILLYITFCA